jgi:hypothetical protein
MNRIERIQKMEQRFDEAKETLNALNSALDRFDEGQKALGQLFDYLGNGQWIKDFEADEAGKLPNDLKRGVLSEDGLYDLVMEYRFLLARMSMTVGISIETGIL